MWGVQSNEGLYHAIQLIIEIQCLCNSGALRCRTLYWSISALQMYWPMQSYRLKNGSPLLSRPMPLHSHQNTPSETVKSKNFAMLNNTINVRRATKILKQVTHTSQDLQHRTVSTMSPFFLSSLFSCAPGLWPGAQLYISLRHSVTDSVTEWLSQKVENICQYRC